MLIEGPDAVLRRRLASVHRFTLADHHPTEAGRSPDDLEELLVGAGLEVAEVHLLNPRRRTTGVRGWNPAIVCAESTGRSLVLVQIAGDRPLCEVIDCAQPCAVSGESTQPWTQSR